MIKRIHSTLFEVRNLKRTAEFYNQLGFDVQESEDAVRIIFGDYRFAFIDEKKDECIVLDQLKGVGLSIYFEVENVKEYRELLQEKGLKIDRGPVDQPWGKRELTISDPDGYKLVFFSNI